jgi:hypothetical protein
MVRVAKLGATNEDSQRERERFLGSCGEHAPDAPLFFFQGVQAETIALLHASFLARPHLESNIDNNQSEPVAFLRTSESKSVAWTRTPHHAVWLSALIPTQPDQQLFIRTYILFPQQVSR